MVPESDSFRGGLQPLSADQIAQLTSQGCSCDDWSKVEVSEGFDAAKVRTTHLSGNVKLGAFEKLISFIEK